MCFFQGMFYNFATTISEKLEQMPLLWEFVKPIIIFFLKYFY